MRNLTYANVMSTLAVVLVVGGGAAYAADTIGSSDVIDNSLRSVDLKNADVRTADVQNDGLTGVDIADQSGVDTCVSTVRLGQLCVRAENQHRTWATALVHCANLDLRIPSLGEAMELAQTHDIPNVDEGESFWTDETFFNEGTLYSYVLTDIGIVGQVPQSASLETVCVTTPTN